MLIIASLCGLVEAEAANSHVALFVAVLDYCLGQGNQSVKLSRDICRALKRIVMDTASFAGTPDDAAQHVDGSRAALPDNRNLEWRFPDGISLLEWPIPEEIDRETGEDRDAFQAHSEGGLGLDQDWSPFWHSLGVNL